jgi:hypothetical protein
MRERWTISKGKRQKKAIRYQMNWLLRYYGATAFTSFSYPFSYSPFVQYSGGMVIILTKLL